MDAIELRARREALGLNQRDMADLLDVKQATISMWETGKRTPKTWEGVSAEVAQLEQRVTEMIDTQLTAAQQTDSGTVTLRTYGDDATFWEASSIADEEVLPSVLHRVATALAAVQLREADEVTVEIVEE